MTRIVITEDMRSEVLDLTNEIMTFLDNKAPSEIVFGASMLVAILCYRGQINLELDMDLVNEACWWIDSQAAPATEN